MRAYTHTHTYARKHTQTYTSTNTHTHANIHIHIHIYIQSDSHIRARTCTHSHPHIQTHETHKHTYSHAHKDTCMQAGVRSRAHTHTHNVLSWSEVPVYGTICRTMSRRLDSSSRLSSYLKRSYLVNLSKYWLFKFVVKLHRTTFMRLHVYKVWNAQRSRNSCVITWLSIRHVLTIREVE